METHRKKDKFCKFFCERKEDPLANAKDNKGVDKLLTSSYLLWSEQALRIDLLNHSI